MLRTLQLDSQATMAAGTKRRPPHPSDRAPIVTDVVTANGRETAALVLARLRTTRAAFADVIYVLDSHGRLEGGIELADLLAADAEQSIDSLCAQVWAGRENDDPEHLASLALHHHMVAVPLIDGEGRLRGAVPPRELMVILRREHIEDLHRMAGIRRERHKDNEQARRAIEAPPLSRARDRLPWLLVGLVGSMFATLLVSRFEATLQARVAVAFFVPGIVYLADAIGTQTEAIAVRGLSLSRAPMRDLLWGELRTGLLIGSGLALLAWPAVFLAFGDARLAHAVALALIVAGAVATTIGLLFPWLLARLGKDPALGSGPVATIVQDVLSLALYLGIAALLLA
jgi:magnesium transporter